ncbi:MAG: diguanylate cyclase [Deltaproteobacteria bacterium]|jgi:diguanylate cyclase (GGDEF)-like protein|nr:diguanylate cyclase [Deltaproteobacteria bacterium]
MTGPDLRGVLRYIAGFALLALLCGALYYISSAYARRDALRAMSADVAFRAETLRNWLDTKAHALAILGATIEAVTGDGPVPLAFLSAYKHDPEVYNTLLVLNDGAFAAGLVAPLDDPAQDKAWLKGALPASEKQSAIGPLVPARTSDSMVFSIATPLKYKSGAQRGVLAFVMLQSTLADFTQKLPLAGHSFLLMDDARRILVPSDPAGGLMDFQSYPGAAQVYDASRVNRQGVLENPLNGAPHIFAYASIPGTGWVLALHAPEHVVLSGVSSLQSLFLLFCSISVACIGYLIQRSWKHDSYRHLSRIDQLTRVGNRAAYEEAFKNLRRKEDFPIALLICDIDNLKIINDTLGHANGDLHLQRFSSVLQGCVRGEDAVFRLGGDEFAILLHGTDAHIMTQLIDRILCALDESSLAHPNKPVLEASIGAALAQNSDELDHLYRRTDAAMYAQKIARKNRAAAPARATSR